MNETMFEKLTECEQQVMKVIWDSGAELSLMEIVRSVNDKYHKDWKPQTVSTFLARLVRKGYLRYYRQGRLFFYQVLIPFEECRQQVTKEFVNFWYSGSSTTYKGMALDMMQRLDDKQDALFVFRMYTLLKKHMERNQESFCLTQDIR